jgi:hypothetical protein
MVPEGTAPDLKSSLKLVQPDELRVTVTLEGSKSGGASAGSAANSNWRIRGTSFRLRIANSRRA